MLGSDEIVPEGDRLDLSGGEQLGDERRNGLGRLAFEPAPPGGASRPPPRHSATIRVLLVDGLLADAERRGDPLPLPTLLACARHLEPFQRVEQRAQRGHSGKADGRIIVGGVAGELRRFLLHESHPTLTQVSSQPRLTAIRLSPPYACVEGVSMRKARDRGPFVERGRGC